MGRVLWRSGREISGPFLSQGLESGFFSVGRALAWGGESKSGSLETVLATSVSSERIVTLSRVAVEGMGNDTVCMRATVCRTGWWIGCGG